jgi:GNAT superfamily N-acetyltransferase
MISMRAAGDADLDVVRMLLREYAGYLNASVGEEHICLENYEKELATLPAPYQTPGGVILLAAVDGEPAGVIALKPLTPLRSAFADERACEMKRLWVRPQFRGLKLGRFLSERLVEEGRARGYTAMYLDTMPRTMQAANRIYGIWGSPRWNGTPTIQCCGNRRPARITARRTWSSFAAGFEDGCGRRKLTVALLSGCGARAIVSLTPV